MISLSCTFEGYKALKMKYVVSVVGLLLIQVSLLAQKPISNPNAIVDTFKKSIPCVTICKVGKTEMSIHYHSPAVKNRVIWGGLVPYNEVWVTGAHSATRLDSDKAFTINGVKIPAGKYALFTIPGKDEWTVIINKNYEQHLTDDYNSTDDIVRVKIKPIALETQLERLQYFIENNKIIIAWEKIKVELPFSIN